MTIREATSVQGVYQLTLDCVDMRPVCPACGKAANVLGQYSPLWETAICRECSVSNPYPLGAFSSEPGGNDRTQLKIDKDSPFELRERRIWADNWIKDVKRGYVDDRPVTKYNLSGRELRNPIRRSKRQHFNRMAQKVDLKMTYRQQSIPFCSRCGCAHSHSYKMLPGVIDYYDKCRRCNDEMSVESLWQNKSIFGGDDDEAVMDRLYNAFPDLFEKGVLPDYWFELKLRAEARR